MYYINIIYVNILDSSPVTPLHPALETVILAPPSALDKPGALYVFDIRRINRIVARAAPSHGRRYRWRKSGAPSILGTPGPVVMEVSGPATGFVGLLGTDPPPLQTPGGMDVTFGMPLLWRPSYRKIWLSPLWGSGWNCAHRCVLSPVFGLAGGREIQTKTSKTRGCSVATEQPETCLKGSVAGFMQMTVQLAVGQSPSGPRMTVDCPPVAHECTKGKNTCGLCGQVGGAGLRTIPALAAQLRVRMMGEMTTRIRGAYIPVPHEAAQEHNSCRQSGWERAGGSSGHVAQVLLLDGIAGRWAVVGERQEEASGSWQSQWIRFRWWGKHLVGPLHLSIRILSSLQTWWILSSRVHRRHGGF
ncbi:hypothetical protein B0H17DRAFT_1140792 [Mycena rosella]|uniref:Uncharacterized protein n=1 Tax=Mycena rosella TaxID=1033263 RepID=A0AAD7G724_MYCRO|nr:hypothetical protein B0H17DRAFT_1140792 [Mycena rosella]